MFKAVFSSQFTWSSWSTAETEGFFNALAFTSLSDGIYLAQGQFSRGHYRTELYQQLGVAQPSLIQQAVTKRQAEFLAGRYLAKRLLSEYCPAIAAVDITIGEARQPLWPNGLQGSITHSKGQVFCLLSLHDKGAVGIDVEHVMSEQLAMQIRSRVYQDHELAVLTDVGQPLAAASTLIFSAKESIFKTLYTNVGEFFGFDAASLVAIDTEQGCLTFHLASDFAERHRLTQQQRVNFALAPAYVLTWMC